MSPTIPEIYFALKGLLERAVAGDGHERADVTVTIGGVTGQSPWDHIVLGNIHEGVWQVKSLGPSRTKRDGSYDIYIAFHCVRPGENADEALEGAYRHYGRLEDILAEEPGLGFKNAPCLSAYISEFKHVMFHDEATRGWRVTVDARIRVSQRLG